MTVILLTMIMLLTAWLSYTLGYWRGRQASASQMLQQLDGSLDEFLNGHH
jgi:hypothetical protein